MTSRVLLGLSSGHKVGLAVVGAVFITFALGSSFLFPRVRPQFPGRGLPAFIVVTFLFFFGMLTAVEVFGAEPKETKKSEHAAQTQSQAQVTTAATATTQTTAPAAAQVVKVTESEFKIVLQAKTLKAGPVTFEVTNAGKIAHDVSIVGGPKTPLIQPGQTATLTTTLSSGPIELYCSVPGHKQAGMDVKTTVGGAATAAPTPPAAARTVSVTETEFKIALSPSSLKAGEVTFDVKNAGKIPHDLTIAGGPKTALIQPGKSATLKAKLKAGPIELYCSVPGHKQAGMDVKTSVG